MPKVQKINCDILGWFSNNVKTRFGELIHFSAFQIMAIIPHPLHIHQSPSLAPLHATSPSSAWTKLQGPEDQKETRKVQMSSRKLKLFPNWILFHPSIPMSWLMRHQKRRRMQDYRLMMKLWIGLQNRRIRIQVKLLPLQIHLIMYYVYPWSKIHTQKVSFLQHCERSNVVNISIPKKAVRCRLCLCISYFTNKEDERKMYYLWFSKKTRYISSFFKCVSIRLWRSQDNRNLPKDNHKMNRVPLYHFWSSSSTRYRTGCLGPLSLRHCNPRF